MPGIETVRGMQDIAGLQFQRGKPKVAGLAFDAAQDRVGHPATARGLIYFEYGTPSKKYLLRRSTACCSLQQLSSMQEARMDTLFTCVSAEVRSSYRLSRIARAHLHLHDMI